MAAAVLTGVVSGSGCELTEVTVTAAEDVVVVEGLVIDGAGENRDPELERIQVLLHRTLGPDGLSQAVRGASVRVVRPDRGDAVVLREAGLALCVASTPVDGDGTCWVARGGDDLVRPGERLVLEVELPDGGRIGGATVVPGELGLLGTPSRGACYLSPDTSHELLWTRAEGAWAYVIDARVQGLPESLAARGIPFDDENLDLRGISVSAADTSLVVPSELGVFDRFDLDRDVAVVLQKGFPPGVEAHIAVAAVERNYVNWVRGGSFNPSGLVRVPSVTGDGTGFFGAAAVASVTMATPPRDLGEAPACGSSTPAAPASPTPASPGPR